MKIPLLLYFLLIATKGICGVTDSESQRTADVTTYPAIVLRIIDGDSIEVLGQIAVLLPNPESISLIPLAPKVSVRLLGINTPELKSCPKAGSAAKRKVEELAPVNSIVRLSQIKSDAYANRIDAKVVTSDGEDIAARLIALGLGQSYTGKRKKIDFCPY